MTDIRAAVHAAAAHGMTLVPSPTDPALCNCRCTKCGWPGRAFDTVLERFAKEPHGCAICAWERLNERDWPYGVWWDASAKRLSAAR